MKKIVFILVMLFTMECSNVYADEIIKHTFNLSDGDLLLGFYNENDSKYAYIEKTGLNPFVVKFGSDLDEYYLNGYIENNDAYYVYGYAHFNNKDTYYDAVLLKIDKQGKVVWNKVFDAGDLEEFIMADTYLDGIVLYAKESKAEEQYQFKNSHIIKYDFYGSTVYEKNFDEEFECFYTNKNILFLSIDNSCNSDYLIDGYGSLIREEDLLDNEYNTEYSDGVKLSFLGMATLNDVIVHSGTAITFPGYYTLVIKGAGGYVEEINFTVHPEISDIEDGQTTYDPVYPIVSDGELLLNGSPFKSGDKIEYPGYYELIIQGANNYQKSINFCINPTITGVENGSEYFGSVTPVFIGSGSLNGESFTSGTIVGTAGNYTLDVYGVNNLTSSVSFKLLDELDAKNKNYVDVLFKNIDLIIIGATIIAGFIIIRKK